MKAQSWWRKERAAGLKRQREHARIMQLKPELRELLYGARSPAPVIETRETAQQKETR
jgi:hypothetical protein